MSHDWLLKYLNALPSLVKQLVSLECSFTTAYQFCLTNNTALIKKYTILSLENKTRPQGGMLDQLK